MKSFDSFPFYDCIPSSTVIWSGNAFNLPSPERPWWRCSIILWCKCLSNNYYGRPHTTFSLISVVVQSLSFCLIIPKGKGGMLQHTVPSLIYSSFLLSPMFLCPRQECLSVMGPGTPLCPFHLSLTESGRFVRREGHCGYKQEWGCNTCSVSVCERGRERARETLGVLL